MKTPRQSSLALIVASALATILAGPAAEAQTYPTRPIQVIVPFAGGSASDVVTRILLDRASKSLGQPFIIDNRPGAGGNTGTLAAARATPDGYTLVATGSGPAAINKALYKRPRLRDREGFRADLAGRGLSHRHRGEHEASGEVADRDDRLCQGATEPAQLRLGRHRQLAALAGAYFEQLPGTKLTHVPYRNIAQYAPDLMAGAVPLGFQWLPNVLAPLKGGGAKAIAVANEKRMAALPDVPTTAEAGVPSYMNSGWFVVAGAEGDAETHHRQAAIRRSPPP